MKEELLIDLDIETWWEQFVFKYADSTTNGNTLTSNGSPSFSSTVPFAGGGGGADAYTYAGTSYANPHAPTSISGTTLSYDNNGNLTAYGTTTYAYDYRNRLTQSALGNSTTTYAYDYFNDRTRQTLGSSTTWYPNKYFSQTATTSTNAYIATTTAYIYANDTLIATVDRVFINSVATGTPTFRYILPDHLGSTNVVTDSSGNVVQTLDYFPYGSVRVNDQVAAANSNRQYIGQFTDNNSLSYLNARYYDSNRGQFISQDLIFWNSKQNLADPQSLNSYSYANGNPLRNKDTTGLKSTESTLQNLRSALSGLVASLNAFNSSLTSQPSSIVISSNQIVTPFRTTTWDPVTDKKIQGLDPRIKQAAINFINTTENQLNKKLVITTGFRSLEEQNRLYNQSHTTGPFVTNAKGGESPHNYGLAIDVAFSNNGQPEPDWKQTISPEIAALAKQEGFEWGGDWKGSFQDYPHFEMSPGPFCQLPITGNFH